MKTIKITYKEKLTCNYCHKTDFQTLTRTKHNLQVFICPHCKEATWFTRVNQPIK